MMHTNSNQRLALIFSPETGYKMHTRVTGRVCIDKSVVRNWIEEVRRTPKARKALKGWGRKWWRRGTTSTKELYGKEGQLMKWREPLVRFRWGAETLEVLPISPWTSPPPPLLHFEECGEVKADLHYSTGNRQSISWHLLYGWNVVMIKKNRIVEWRWAIWVNNIIEIDSCCFTHFFQVVSFGVDAGLLVWLYNTITHTSSLPHSRNCVEEAESESKANTTVHMKRRLVSPFQNPRNSNVNSRNSLSLCRMKWGLLPGVRWSTLSYVNNLNLPPGYWFCGKFFLYICTMFITRQ